MPHFDASTADCLLFTFKEGLLSAVAHDLKLRVTRFSIDVSDDRSSVQGEFAADSLRVIAAQRDGRDDPSSLGDSDRRKIEGNIVDDVLSASRHPQIRFASSRVQPVSGGYDVTGELSLHGQRRTLTLQARQKGDRLVAEVTLHQPDFGIKPYTAMLGTLRIRPDVKLQLSLPWQPATT